MEKQQFFLYIQRIPVEVSKEVYEASKYWDRHERTQKEKDIRNQVYSYNALDTDDMLGVEMFRDSSAPSVEDQAIARVMSEKLRDCLLLLPEADRRLIVALYVEGKSEAAAGREFGISQPAVSKRRERILKKLRNSFK